MLVLYSLLVLNKAVVLAMLRIYYQRVKANFAFDLSSDLLKADSTDGASSSKDKAGIKAGSSRSSMGV